MYLEDNIQAAKPTEKNLSFIFKFFLFYNKVKIKRLDIINIYFIIWLWYNFRERGINMEEQFNEELENKQEIEPFSEEFVDFETFSKSDFRVVKIKNCKIVPKSNKLLEFTLDDGTEEERTILSGIREYYDPAFLIGKTAVAIVNLPPRKMMGIDSSGMLISAAYNVNGEERLNLLLLDDNIPAGAKLY